MGESMGSARPPPPRNAIVVMNLSFSYTPHVAGSEVLRGVSFKVPVGARVVLVGLNGAGKSTLLSILAGARMCPEGAVTVLGEDAFRGSSVHRRVVLVSAEWTAAVGGMSSASAAELMAAAVTRAAEEQRAETAERGRRLAELLGVDAGWQVYALSEGQRRRLHLVIKLMPLYEVALLDEATTDLDIVARRNLLLFLRHDSAARRATVVYCTHIFDGLEGWASHLALVEGARMARLDNCLSIPALSHAFAAGRHRPLSSPLAKHSKPDPAASSMYEVVRAWLKKGTTPTDSDHAAARASHSLGGAGVGRDGLAVQVTNLWWGWGSGASVWGGQKYVLRGLGCSVAAGSRVVLAGANGAGKSSLINILAGAHMITPKDAALVLGCQAFEDYRLLNRRVVLLSQEWRQTLKCVSSGGCMTLAQVCK
jgi:CCR4-NOT complex subunit CAF16